MSKSVDVTVNGRRYSVELVAHERGRVRFVLGEREYEVSIEDRVVATELSKRDEARGKKVSSRSSSARKSSTKERGSTNTVTAPIPGVVIEVLVKEGQSIAKGDVLLRLEAMKMQNNIIAYTTGKVSIVHVSVGDEVIDGELLLTID